MVVALLLTSVLLRAVYVWHYRVDSDEPQHLHVAWGWAHGLVQYRDLFDNHAPLFHLLCAPLVKWLGERADILVPMRLAMLPLYIVSLVAVHAIGRALFSNRVAAWATAIAAFAPGFFLTSIEFRADDLWAASWLAALATLVVGRLTMGRCFVVGMLLGVTLAVSLKTTLLLAGLAGGVLATAVARYGTAVGLWWRTDGPRVIAALAGASIVPAVVLALFARERALAPMFYATVSHNTLPGLGQWHQAPWRIALLPASIAPLWFGGVLFARGAATPGIATRRRLVFVATGVFFVLLFGAWPLVTREDLIPASPLVAILVTPAILGLSGQLARFFPPATTLLRAPFATPLLVVALEIAAMTFGHPPWRDEMSSQTALVAAVLKITGPNDYVMDLKGETIFRRRPYYYVLEHITKARLERGLLSDSIPEDLVEKSTAVVLEDRPGFPARGRAFMNDNYLSVDGQRLRVLGRMLTPGDPRSRLLTFEVVVPARYTIVADRDVVHGALDGVPYAGPRVLASGHHEFVADRDGERFALVWAPAAEKGWSPFPAVAGGAS